MYVLLKFHWVKVHVYEVNIENTIICVLPDTKIKSWLILLILLLFRLLWEFLVDFPDCVLFQKLNKKDTVLKQTELHLLFLWSLWKIN